MGELRVKLRGLLSSAANFLFPRRCLLCGDVLSFYSDSALCPECRESYEAELAKSCPACGNEFRSCRCSVKRFRSFNQTGHTALGFYRTYDDSVGRLVYRLKREYDRDLQRFFARALADRLKEDLGEAVAEYTVTYPPRGKKALRRYGFDQSEGVSRLTAGYLGCDRERLFVRTGGVTQKKLSYRGRQENAAEAFSLEDGAQVRGRKFIVIDDVITTGATVGALCDILIEKGAAAVYPAALFLTAPKVPEASKVPELKDEGLWFEED